MNINQKINKRKQNNKNGKTIKINDFIIEYILGSKNLIDLIWKFLDIFTIISLKRSCKAAYNSLKDKEEDFVFFHQNVIYDRVPDKAIFKKNSESYIKLRKKTIQKSEELIYALKWTGKNHLIKLDEAIYWFDDEKKFFKQNGLSILIEDSIKKAFDQNLTNKQIKNLGHQLFSEGEYGNVELTQSNDQYYSGGMFKDQKTGFGILNYHDNSKFRGQFEKGRKKGWGLFENDNNQFKSISNYKNTGFSLALIVKADQQKRGYAYIQNDFISFNGKLRLENYDLNNELIEIIFGNIQKLDHTENQKHGCYLYQDCVNKTMNQTWYINGKEDLHYNIL